MPATIRIDFDVNASSISEALKQELTKVQGVVSSSNAEIEKSQKARIAAVANDAINSDKKVAAEAAAAYKQRDSEQKAIAKAFSDYEKQQTRESAAIAKQTAKEISDYEKQQEKERLSAIKEREKQEKYLMQVRMNSIKEANKAEEAAEKAHGEHAGGIFAELKEKAGGALGMAGMAGVAAGAGVAIEKLFEAGEKVHKQQLELETGFRATGKSEEEATSMTNELMQSSKQLALQYGLTHDEINTGTAAYLKMGGSTDNIAEKQKILIGLANKAGVSMEMAAKMLAKSTDPESAAGLGRLGIKFEQGATQAEKFAVVQAKITGNLAGMQSAAEQNPMAKMQEMFSQLTESAGGLVFGVLHPFIDVLSNILTAIMPIVSILEELGKVVGDIVKDAMEPLNEIISVVSGLFKDLMPVIRVLINAALIPIRIAIWEIKTVVNFVIEVFKFWINVYSEIISWIDKTLGISKFLTAAWQTLSKTVQDVIGWFTKAVDTVKNIGSSLLSLIGIHTEEKKALETSKTATEAMTKAREAEEERIKKEKEATEELIASMKKEREAKMSGAKEDQDNAIAMIESIDRKLKSGIRQGTETTESLTKLRAQWVEAGKAAVEAQSNMESVHHSIALEIGAAADKTVDTTKKAAAAEKAAARDLYNELKATKDQQFEEELIKLKNQFNARSIGEKKFHDEERNATIAHTKDLLDIATKMRDAELAKARGNKELIVKYNNEIRSLTKTFTDQESADRTKDDSEELATLKLQFSAKKEAAEDYGIKNNLTERAMKAQEYKIDSDSYKAQIALLEKQNADTTKLKLEYDGFLRKHGQAIISQNRKDAEEIAKVTMDTEKARIDAMKDSVEKQKALTGLALSEELAKEKKELAMAGDNEALKTAIHQQQEEKRNQISKKFAEEEKHRKMEQISFLTGPFANGFQKTTDELNAKFFQPILNKWISQKTFVGGILSDLTTSVIKYAENWIIQKGLAAAADLLFGASETAAMAAIAAAAAPAATAVSLASFGANAIAADAAMSTSAALGTALFAGKKEGGFTGYGDPNQPSGHYTHKNEFVLKSGSFAVDSNGNLVSVAGMHGGNNAPVVNAIQQLGAQMSQSTVINQRRMVLENKVTERSRSRESV